MTDKKRQSGLASFFKKKGDDTDQTNGKFS